MKPFVSAENNSMFILNPWAVHTDTPTNIVSIFRDAGFKVDYIVLGEDAARVSIFFTKGHKKSANKIIKHWKNLIKQEKEIL